MVLMDGKVSATDGRFWYQLGKLQRSRGTRIRLSVTQQNNKQNVSSLYLFRFIQLFADLLKLSGLDVVMASKSTS